MDTVKIKAVSVPDRGFACECGSFFGSWKRIQIDGEPFCEHTSETQNLDVLAKAMDEVKQALYSGSVLRVEITR